MISLSVIIPSYNSRRTIALCLDALIPQLNESSELLVVDSSGDGTGRFLRERYPSIGLETISGRVNAAFARNYGVARTRGTILVFIDSDVIVPPQWLSIVRSLLPRLESAAGIGSAIRPHGVFGAVGGALHLIQFSEFLRPSQAGGWNCPSCALVVSRERFVRTGGFPKEFDMAEDLIFSWSASSAGKSRFVFPDDLWVEHINRESTDYFHSHLEELGFWSARARRTVDLPGARLVRTFRGLSAGPIAHRRLRRIEQRVGGYGGDLEKFFVLNRGLIQEGLAAWSEGFRRGAR